jgi:hypothetical protein
MTDERCTRYGYSYFGVVIGLCKQVTLTYAAIWKYFAAIWKYFRVYTNVKNGRMQQSPHLKFSYIMNTSSAGGGQI